MHQWVGGSVPGRGRGIPRCRSARAEARGASSCEFVLGVPGRSERAPEASPSQAPLRGMGALFTVLLDPFDGGLGLPDQGREARPTWSQTESSGRPDGDELKEGTKIC
jgi:hypothetical protein